MSLTLLYGSVSMPRCFNGYTGLYPPISFTLSCSKTTRLKGRGLVSNLCFRTTRLLGLLILKRNLRNFSSIDSYCNHIKLLADQLADVDAPLTNNRLVLKLTAGLPEAYVGTVDIIQNQEPLPSFVSCRSRLKLAERTIKNRLAKEGNPDNCSQAALLTSIDSHHDMDNNTSASSASSRQSSKGNKQKKSNSKVFGKSHNSNGQVAPQQSGLMPFN